MHAPGGGGGGGGDGLRLDRGFGTFCVSEDSRAGGSKRLTAILGGKGSVIGGEGGSKGDGGRRGANVLCLIFSLRSSLSGVRDISAGQRNVDAVDTAVLVRLCRPSRLSSQSSIELRPAGLTTAASTISNPGLGSGGGTGCLLRRPVTRSLTRLPRPKVLPDRLWPPVEPLLLRLVVVDRMSLETVRSWFWERSNPDPAVMVVVETPLEVSQRSTPIGGAGFREILNLRVPTGFRC